MSYNHKYNTDNILTRSVIVGLVNLLNNKIQFANVLSDTEQDVIEVPWFFSQSGDERFMQDYFTQWNDCIHPSVADGNYDVIPRGIITLRSESINTNALTHRFVRGKRVKEIDGQLHTFNAFMNSIPLTMNFECEIKCDSFVNALKIQQAIREVFYGVQIFHTSFNGFRIPCQVGFPDDLGLQKTFEYGYQDDTDPVLNFSLELETYHPVLDKTTERHESNRIQGFGHSLEVGIEDGLITVDERTLTILSPVDHVNPDVYYSGSVMPIKWDSTGSILRIDIYYTLNAGEDWLPIQRTLINNGEYTWNVPTFQDTFPYVVLSQDVAIEAKIRPIVNSLGEIEDIIVFEGGSGYNNNLRTEVEENGFSGDPAEVEPIVANGSITGFNIINKGSGYTPTAQHTIGIKIIDSNNSNVLGEVHNILIT